MGTKVFARVVMEENRETLNHRLLRLLRRQRQMLEDRASSDQLLMLNFLHWNSYSLH